MPTRRIKVTGKVQGVFFRATTKETAEKFGLTGWVCNEKDGSVSIEVDGERNALDTFCEWLWIGSKNCDVDKVEVSKTTRRVYEGFEIRG